MLILLDAERLAVAFLVLEDVCVLLALQPLVLQVEQNRVLGATSQQFVHAVAVLEPSGVIEATLRAFHRIGVRLPLVVRELVEVVEDGVQIVRHVRPGAGDEWFRLLVVLWLERSELARRHDASVL